MQDTTSSKGTLVFIEASSKSRTAYSYSEDGIVRCTVVYIMSNVYVYDNPDYLYLLSRKTYLDACTAVRVPVIGMLLYAN